MIPFTSIKSTLFAVGLVLLIGNSYTHLSAQSNITKASTPIAHFTNYNTEQGLALSSISSSIVDQKGYIWFGTFGGGVSRFDGKQFTNFTTTHGLTHNTVWTLFEDSKGNIWFGTDGNGVSKFDGSKFTNYSTKDGLAQNTILSIFEDSKGNMWFGTNKSGVSKFDGTSFSNFNVNADVNKNSVWSIQENKTGIIYFGTGGAGLLSYNGKEILPALDELTHQNINVITKDDEGNFWLGTNNGLMYFDGVTTQSFSLLENTEVTAITISSTKDIWLGTKQQGVIMLRTDCLEENPNNPDCMMNFTTQQGLAHNRIFSIAEDAYGNLWIGTYGGGISKYNGDALFVYTTQQGLAQNRIWSTLEDHEGNLWFGTNDNGLCKFDGRQFTTYTTKDGLADNTVWAIFQDKNKHLWIGTEGGGVSQFDGKTFTNYTTQHGLVHNDIRSIAQDKEGNLWFGSNGGGVSKYDGKSFTNYTTENGLAQNNIRSILSDNNNVWLATNGNGVSVYNSGKFTHYNEKNGLPNSSIKCLLKDGSGNIWLGTSGSGIVRFDGNNFLSINTNDGLADNVVYDIVEDENGTLWLGTNLGFSSLKLKENDVKTPIGKVTLSNNDLKLKAFYWEHFNTKTGFPIKDLNTNSMSYTKVGLPNANYSTKGLVWGACGDDKVVRFDVKNVAHKNKLPKLFIQKVKINEQNISWYTLMKNNDGSLLKNDQALAYENVLDSATIRQLKTQFAAVQFSGVRNWFQVPENLVLPYELNNIAFDFIAVETNRNFMVKYQYALIEYTENFNFDEVEWSPLSAKSTANYNNLWEGKYTFLLKAETPEGNRTPIQTYHFTVLPPWWRTWWMYALYGLALIGIVYLIVKLNGRRLAARAKELTIEVEKATKEIIEQKKIVEDKHKEITDSIHYAKRIQQAILPTDEYITQILPDSFLFYQPKDVVSGDFYWVESLPLPPSKGGGTPSPSGRAGEGHTFFAVADCTGHGVPGAMVSVVCSNALSKTLLEEGIVETGKLLTRAKEIVIERFAKSGGVRDGMDIALCSLKLSENSAPSENYELQFSGANRPLIIVRNGELIKIKPDKQPIGKSTNNQPFTSHTITVLKGDMVYLFSDGYADQFGGEKGKKFMTKQLYDLLIQIANKPLSVQQNTLKQTLKTWQGNYHQVDDICIMGVRI